MTKLGLIIVSAVVITIVILANTLYIVTDRETAIKLRFGEIIDSSIEPGLHSKFQSSHHKKFDERVLTLDNLPQPYFTAEKKRLIVDYFVKWRITDDEQFYITTSGGQLSALRALLTQRADEGLRNQFGTRKRSRGCFWGKR